MVWREEQLEMSPQGESENYDIMIPNKKLKRK
jgi:hypothetical protein